VQSLLGAFPLCHGVPVVKQASLGVTVSRLEDRSPPNMSYLTPDVVMNGFRNWVYTFVPGLSSVCLTESIDSCWAVIGPEAWTT
jgi:hypothetical protein